MWIVAGLIIGSLVFVAAYTLLSHWVHNNEVNQAQESFSQLTSSVLNVCSMGSEKQEITNYLFPKNVVNISAYNKSSDTYGSGDSLCINIYQEGRYCEELKKRGCNLPINLETIELMEKDNLFTIVQKALGQPKISNIKFNITKGTENTITINWKEQFNE